MRTLWPLVSVLVVTGLTATSAAPTPTETHDSRVDMSCMQAQSAQNNEPGVDQLPSQTRAKAIETLSVSQTGTGVILAGVCGLKWVLVPCMQVGSLENTTIRIDTKTRIHTQSESGGMVMNIAAWSLGKEIGWGPVGVMVVTVLGVMIGMVVLAVVLRCSCTSLWSAERMKRTHETGMEEMQKRQAEIRRLPEWGTGPMGPGPSEMRAVPTAVTASPLSPRTPTDAVYSPSGTAEGTRPLRTTYPW